MMSQDTAMKQHQLQEVSTMIKFKTKRAKEVLRLQEANRRLEESTAIEKTQAKLAANLRSAANEGKVELVRLLIRCGADLNAQDEQFGNTPLHLAAWNGFSQTVEVLCKHRANTSIKNKAHFSALHMACQQGHNQSARLLLMASVRTDAKNSYGDTPLHTAARYGHAGVARILLSARCNPNQVNKNHDTPLHIAAAMGRRKLTKIFMQNGAEPAIKNKQNETAMDIALRKDLIDIQEIIANPPPARRHAPVCLSQLEQRYGQLYGAGRRPRQHRQARAPSSDESASSELRPVRRGHAKRSRRHVERSAHELAVDVPDEPSQLVTHNKFSNSLSALINPALTQRRARTKTIAGTRPELDLVSSLLARRRSSTELANRPTSKACPPDGGDNQAEWADMVAKSARCSATADRHMIREEASPGCSPSTRAALTRPKSTSPGGSLRSTLSKSRGRLVQFRHRKQRPSLLARRPNLGTCVGKLSLLRLRNMVNKRREDLERPAERPEAEPSQEEHHEDAPAEAQARQASAGAAGRGTNVGRRVERLARLREQTPLAPNGTRLVAARPLASLADESQLYALPKKCKPKQQVVASDNSPTDTVAATAQPLSESATAQPERPDAEQGAVRVSSAGPALTSDGNNSSSAGSSSSFAPSADGGSPSSSSDECAQSLDLVVSASKHQSPASSSAVVGVHADLYSVVRAREHQPEPDKSTEPCLCRPAYGKQRDASPKRNNLSPPVGQLDERQSSSHSGTSQPKTSAQQVSPAGSKQAAPNDPASTKPNRLRQLFHLESKTKTRPTASLHQISTQDQSLTSEPNNQYPNRQPTSAIESGYYAYSPVVQSSTDTTKPPETNKDLTDIEKSNPKNTGAKKASWLKSRFSLSLSSVPAQPDTGIAISEPSRNESRARDYETNGLSSRESFSTLVGPERKAELISIDEIKKLTKRDLLAPASDQPRLIRPKSALSTTSAELIAAQKSLAAAAVAKVKRDRVTKILPAIDTDHSHHNYKEANNKDSILTVKTCDPGEFWSHHGSSIAVNNATVQKYMIGQSLVKHHSSGTNSAGMSESSPSNGAESDNSIQTSSGSTNTDAGGQQNEINQGSNPLGILSRILLNNKSFGCSANKLEQTNSTNGPAQTNGGSVSSSSALSSPISGHNQSPSTAATTNEKHCGLDQLSSRSRCPIVLSRTASNEQTAILPNKSVLKSSLGQQLKSGAERATTAFSSQISDSLVNGLPRVPSYNNTTYGLYPKPSELCNFHALANRNQMVQQAHYNPYSAYSYMNEPYEMSAVKYPAARMHRMSHHDLRSIEPPLNLTLPASAVNYEYYLDNTAPSYQTNRQQQFHQHYSSANESHLYPRYSHDDSIYIPAYLSGSGSDQMRDTSQSSHHLTSNGSTVLGGVSRATDLIGKCLALRHHQEQPDSTGQLLQRPRPKSSIDNILSSSSTNSTPNGPRQLSATQTGQLDFGNSRQRNYYNNNGCSNYPVRSYLPAVYSKNSIYATQNSSVSDLTVLPTANELANPQSTDASQQESEAEKEASTGCNVGPEPLARQKEAASWTSAAPYRSLIHINGSKSPDKLNQPSQTKSCEGQNLTSLGPSQCVKLFIDQNQAEDGNVSQEQAFDRNNSTVL